MSSKRKVQSLVHWLCAASAGLGLAGCVTAAESDESETHFLSCQTDADCVEHGAGLVCVQKECHEQPASNADDGSSVPAASDTEGSDTAVPDTGEVEDNRDYGQSDDSETSWAPEPSASADAPPDPTTSSEPPPPDASSNPPACSGPGHYERGKEGGPPACCEGLREVIQQSAYEGEGGVHLCGDPPGHVNFACVAGECGDGQCEAGEDVPCGCAEDCPDAAWETIPSEVDASSTAAIEDAGSTDIPNTAPGDAGPANEGGVCAGIGAACTTDEECLALGADLQCLEDRCLPLELDVCGGAAGALCDAPPFTTCATLVGDFGVCLTAEDAECVCSSRPDAACADHAR